MPKATINNEVVVLKKRLRYMLLLWSPLLLFFLLYVAFILVPILQDDGPLFALLGIFAVFTIMGPTLDGSILSILFYGYLTLALIGTIYLTVKK